MQSYFRVLCVLLGLFPLCIAGGVSPAEEPEKKPEIKSLILPGESFLVENRPAFILWPDAKLRRTPQPWVFYAPTLAGYPDDHERWMHEKFLAAGVAVAGIDVGEAYGSPASRKLFDAFYTQMTSMRGLSNQPCLLGRSRGGLWVTAWACDHPERFSGLAGIYPVFDFRTYPGIEKAAPAYGLTATELESQNERFNPIARMSVLAKAKLPVMIIHGDEDTVVPLKENSSAFAETYNRAGASDAINLIVVKGQGHNFWEGFFRCQELVDFVIVHAISGANTGPSEDAEIDAAAELDANAELDAGASTGTEADTQSSTTWGQFLGPDRNGISKETGLVDTIPQDGPKVLWRVPGGVGMSGIVVSNDQVLTLVQRDGQQRLISLDFKSGKPKWDLELSADYKNGMGDGPRATPTIHGDRVFAFTGEGKLVAADLATGKMLWSNDLFNELGGKPSEYGMSCSPLVVGETVVVALGAPGAAVVAVDQSSGKLVWKTGDGAAGYSSPALLTIAGKSQIVAFIGLGALGLDPTSGRILWQYDYETDYNCNTATPIAIDDQVLLSSGENHGSVLLKLEPQGDAFSTKEVWSSWGGGSVFRSEWQTPIHIDGHAYGFDNVGSAGPVTHLTCIDAKTGKVAWRETRFGKGNLIAADRKLIISTFAGELVLARLNPKSYEELGRAKVIGKTRQAPVLADGKLFLRDDAEIVCIDFKR